jgi:flagellar biosynthetic protein FliO
LRAIFASLTGTQSNRGVGVLIGLTVACGVALVALRWWSRAKSDAAGMRVVGRLALEPRRSIYLVEIGGRCFMVGVGDGPMTMLGEVDAPPPLRAVS